MLTIEEALARVLSCTRPLGVARVELGESLNRTLAADIATDIDQPPFDRSLMDGFAIQSDTNPRPTSFRIVGQIAAGQMATVVVRPGEAVQINTGAMIPAGANAVVRVEDCTVSNDGRSVTIRAAAKPGQFITPRGEYRTAGDKVLLRGAMMGPPNIGVAAAAGASTVQVFRQPRVAIVITGSELVEVSARPDGAQIRNTNAVQLAAMVRSLRCDPVSSQTVEDERKAIRSAIVGAQAADVICLTGGVSMGAFDFVPTVLLELGAECHFHKVSIKPGRPILFATLPHGSLVFALPGNPVSCIAGFYLLVAPALAALQGRQEPPVYERGILRGTLGEEGTRRAFYPASLRVNAHGETEVTRLSWRGSGDALGMAGAQALIMRHPGGRPAGDGEFVEFIRL